MNYQPRTIAFLSELVHPPRPPDPRPVQKLHDRMFDGRMFDGRMFDGRQPAYASFSVTPAGPLLSNPPSRPGATSQVAFLADRIQFREEGGVATAESFAQRVVEVLQEAAPLRGIEVLTGHRVTMRSLINPRHFTDSRRFLKEAVFGFGEEVEVLGRAPQLYGLRLVFPPAEDEPAAFALRIESYRADARSLFVEVQGTFGPLLVADGLEPLGEHVHGAYRFLRRRVLPFVARFDARQPS